MHYVYILKCSDASLYIGYAKDVAKRIVVHNTGKRGAKYTRSRRPVVLVHQEGFRTLSKALKREHELKKWSRAKKLAFLKST